MTSRWWYWTNLCFIADETDDITITTTVRSATIYGLRRFTNYSVQVLALTRVGQGVASRPVYISTLADCKSNMHFVEIRRLRVVYFIKQRLSKSWIELSSCWSSGRACYKFKHVRAYSKLFNQSILLSYRTAQRLDKHNVNTATSCCIDISITYASIFKLFDIWMILSATTSFESLDEAWFVAFINCSCWTLYGKSLD